MSSLSSRTSLFVAVVVASAVSAAATAWITRDAHAQSPGAMVVQLPAQGIVFRGANGRLVARLRGDANGGALELFDAREDVAVRLQATPSGGALDLRAARDAHPAALDIVRSAPRDPGY